MGKYKHYKTYDDIRGDGRIILYTRNDQTKNWFYVRLKFPHIKGYIIRSAKTTDEYEARRFAEDLYYETEGRLRRGENINHHPFKKVFKEWAKQRRLEGKEKVYTEDDIRTSELYALPYLSDYDIRKIDMDVLNGFFDKRLSLSKSPPSVSTLKQEVRRLRSIMNFALDRGFIQRLPKFPSFKGKRNPRPDFTGAEWNRLYKFMRGHVKAVKANKAHYRDRYYLQQYVLILANSGIRVGEARNLKWSDVSNTRTLKGGNRMVLNVTGKTGNREVVCNKNVESYLKRLYEFRKEEFGSNPSLDEHIFAHPNGLPIKSLKKSFASLLDRSGLTYNSVGQKRVPYSLRHTYATMRLQEGVSVFQLASNMGTSVEMIEAYYGKKRNTTAKAASELTKMGGREKRSDAEDVLPWYAAK
jgi:integrase